MLTDEQLTDDLARAFRGITSDLTYAGRVPRPRRGPGAAVPTLAATAAAAVVVAVPVVANQRHDAPTARQPQATATASPTESARTGGHADRAPRGRTVTGSIRLAGYRINLDRDLDGHVVAIMGVAVPEDATTLPGIEDVEAFAGTDEESGDPAVFVRVPIDGGRQRVFELTSADLTTDQLAELLRPRSARPVPLVSR